MIKHTNGMKKRKGEAKEEVYGGGGNGSWKLPGVAEMSSESHFSRHQSSHPPVL